MKTRRGVWLVLVGMGLLGCGGTGNTADADDDGRDGGAADVAGVAPDLEETASAPLECTPADVDDFTPTWRAPHPPQPGACSADAIDRLFDKWLRGTNASRKQFELEHATCFACAVSSIHDAQQGPIVRDPAHRQSETNIAACVAAIDGDYSASGCAAKVQAVEDCRRAACDSNCPVVDATIDADVAAWNFCRNEALDACSDWLFLAEACLEPARYEVCMPFQFAYYDDWVRATVIQLCG